MSAFELGRLSVVGSGRLLLVLDFGDSEVFGPVFVGIRAMRHCSNQLYVPGWVNAGLISIAKKGV